MIRRILGTSLVLFAAVGAFGQTTGAPAFDVASVKPAPPPTGGGFVVRMGNTPGRVTYNGVTIKNLLMTAYKVKNYQITGPSWLDSERYDVTATYPADTPKDQIPLMLQKLLADRFQLVLHKEQKELPVYALVVAKNGPKLKESVDDPNAPAMSANPSPEDLAKLLGGPNGRSAPVGTVGPGGGGGGGGSVNVNTSYTFNRVDALTGKDGVPAGRGGMMRMSPGHMVATKMTLPALATNLSSQMDRPVLDETGLTKTYDFTLDWTPENMGGRGGSPSGSAADGGGGDRAPSASTPDAPNGPPLGAALQQQLGLRLEPKKAPFDILVIDSANKVPIEN